MGNSCSCDPKIENENCKKCQKKIQKLKKSNEGLTENKIETAVTATPQQSCESTNSKIKEDLEKKQSLITESTPIQKNEPQTQQSSEVIDSTEVQEQQTSILESKIEDKEESEIEQTQTIQDQEQEQPQLQQEIVDEKIGCQSELQQDSQSTDQVAEKPTDIIHQPDSDEYLLEKPSTLNGLSSEEKLDENAELPSNEGQY